MIKLLVSAAILAASPMAQVAYARDETVTVDAKAGPWSVKANPKMPYGVGDARPSVVIRGIEPDSGKVEIYPDGSISVDGHTFDSSGDADRAVDDSTGRKGKRFPSFYTPKLLYPAPAHGLVGVFVDDKGVVVGRPFMIGKGVRVAIPERATGLSLGFNDDSFAMNSGSISVRVVLPD